MNTYYKIGILILSVVIIGGLSWFLFLRPDTTVTNQPQPKDLNEILTDLSGRNSNEFVRNENSGPLPPLEVTPTGANLSPLSPEEQAQQVVKEAASRFVERWGTYSNETDLSSLRALSDSMTPRMQPFIDDYIYNIRADHPYQDGYYGLTTKAATMAIEDFDINATSLNVLIGTRREESLPTGDVKAYNQEVRVELQLLDDAWQVNSVYWLDE